MQTQALSRYTLKEENSLEVYIMKEWKVVAIASFAANVVMVILLIIAFVNMKSTVTAKNEQIDTLQQQATQDKKAPQKQAAVQESEPTASHTEELQREHLQLKSAMKDLPTEATLVASDKQTEAIMHYEDANMQAEANLNNVYETLTRELSGREKAHFQLDQKKWLQDLKSIQAKQLSAHDDTAKLDVAKEAYERTMARSEELLQKYDIN